MKQVLLIGADVGELSKAIAALSLNNDVEIISISHDDLSEQNSLQKIKDEMIIFGIDFEPYIKIASLTESTPPEFFGRTTVSPIKKVHHNLNHRIISKNRNVQRRHVSVNRGK